MTSSKSQKERMWRVRKDAQHPHGKVPLTDELSENTPNDKKLK